MTESRGAKMDESVSIAQSLTPEECLSIRDRHLKQLIARDSARWPVLPTENPITGLVRIVMAQQVSTTVACRIARQVLSMSPALAGCPPAAVPTVASLRGAGLPERRASCCVEILSRGEELLARARDGEPWELVLSNIKGVGPWTVAVFRIMVLRHPDVLPNGDVGLQRAFSNVYGPRANLARRSETWRPFRSVACWYLWRTLGNEQLG